MAEKNICQRCGHVFQTLLGPQQLKDGQWRLPNITKLESKCPNLPQSSLASVFCSPNVGVTLYGVSLPNGSKVQPCEQERHPFAQNGETVQQEHVLRSVPTGPMNWKAVKLKAGNLVYIGGNTVIEEIMPRSIVTAVDFTKEG